MNQVTRAVLAVFLLFILVQAGGCAVKRPCSDVNVGLAGSDEPPHECRVDGCSMAPDLSFGHCCDTHDEIYWFGGSAAKRKQADVDFRACIEKSEHEVFAGIYYYGVRLGGTPYLPTPWRWGFGWDYPRGYTVDIVIVNSQN